MVSLSPSSSDSQEISLSSTAPDKDNQEDNGGKNFNACLRAIYASLSLVRMTTDGPRVVECEGGGYQVDPATISSSPIRSVHTHTHTHTPLFSSTQDISSNH